MDLPQPYLTIMISSASFPLVPRLENAEMALSNFHDHGLPGDTLVMSIWHRQDHDRPKWSEWWLVVEKNGCLRDKTVRKWERPMYDPSTLLRHTETKFEIFKDGEVQLTEMHRRSPERRNYSVEQLAGLTERSGGCNIQVLAGFSRQPATEADEEFYRIATWQTASSMLNWREVDHVGSRR